MKVFAMVTGALFGCLTSLPAMADSTVQPPMNDFDFAFYECANGAAFQVTYDSDAPKTATMTTNDDNRQYVLNRTDAPSGVAFANGPTRFWTDGKTVVVAGTNKPFKECKLKHS